MGRQSTNVTFVRSTTQMLDHSRPTNPPMMHPRTPMPARSVPRPSLQKVSLGSILQSMRRRGSLYVSSKPGGAQRSSSGRRERWSIFPSVIIIWISLYSLHSSAQLRSVQRVTGTRGPYFGTTGKSPHTSRLSNPVQIPLKAVRKCLKHCVAICRSCADIFSDFIGDSLVV